MEGEYYIAGENDEMGAPEGAVVFALVARNGYKMPNVGYCYMDIDADGTLLISEIADSNANLTKTDPEYAAVLTRVPHVRYVTESAVYALDDGERIHVDIAADGTPEEVGCSFVWNENKSVIESIICYLEGEEYTLDDPQIYGADIYLMVPALSGAVYFYIDGQSDNDYHYMTIVGVSPDDVWYAGDFYGGFAEEPTDVNALNLMTRESMLSTVHTERLSRVGTNGLPEAIDPYYAINSSLELTVKQDVDCWSVNGIGQLMQPATLSAGEKVSFVRTDGVSFTDLQTESGDIYRVWVSTGEWPRTIGGVNIEDCFDGLRFAG